jgi:hypothetical protein
MILDRIRGVCAVYDEPSVLYDLDERPLHRKIFAAEALRLAGSNPWLDVAHMSAATIASRADGTLRVWATNFGVLFEADFAADPRGCGVRDMMRGRADWQCSIGFTMKASSWGHDGETPVETITWAELEHISITDNPAFAGTACWLQSTPFGALPRQHRASARQWQFAQINRDRAKLRQLAEFPTGPTASARARGHFIIPEAVMRTAALLAKCGRCA